MCDCYGYVTYTRGGDGGKMFSSNCEDCNEMFQWSEMVFTAQCEHNITPTSKKCKECYTKQGENK